jgi:membrane associated rhomboid family serine protease
MHQRIPEYYVQPPWKPRMAWVTWTVLGTTVAVFLLQLGSLHLYGTDWVGDSLAFSPQALSEYRYWTLLTYAWAHAVALFDDPGLFWLHIVANMIPLVCLGPALEDFLGHARFLGLYLGGAIFSALVWLAFTPADDASGGIIGASGAIFALIAAAGTAAPRARVVVYLFYILPIRMSMRVLALSACGIELVQAIPALDFLPQVAHSAHLGGAAFGFLYIMAIRLTSRTPLVMD